jgi:hypothetical protein
MKAIILVTLLLLVGCGVSSAQREPQSIPVPNTERATAIPIPTSTFPPPTVTVAPTPTAVPRLNLTYAPGTLVEPAPLLAGSAESLKVYAVKFESIPRPHAVGAADVRVELIPINYPHFPEDPFLVTATISVGSVEFPLDSYGEYVMSVSPKQITFFVIPDGRVSSINVTVPVIKLVKGEVVGFKFRIDSVQ